MYDVVALGELLIDFTTAGKSERGNAIFECNAGGAPANVLAALARLGKSTSFIGKVGNDKFGTFLENVLIKNKVNTDGLIFSDKVNTTLAFVHLDDKGDRSFSFYRNPGADMMLEEKEIDSNIIKQCRIFHFGSVSMTDNPAKDATLKAVEIAKSYDKIVSFDPNLRPALWKDLDTAKKMIIDCLKYVDILKVSEEELEFITDVKDLAEGSELLRNKYDLKLIFVTLGSEGCFYRKGEHFGKIDGYEVDAIDTTGAGDGFLGGILYKILEYNKSLNEINANEIEEAVSFANGLGALVTTKKGAIPSMPALFEINQLIVSKQRNIL